MKNLRKTVLDALYPAASAPPPLANFELVGLLCEQAIQAHHRTMAWLTSSSYQPQSTISLKITTELDHHSKKVSKAIHLIANDSIVSSAKLQFGEMSYTLFDCEGYADFGYVRWVDADRSLGTRQKYADFVDGILCMADYIDQYCAHHEALAEAASRNERKLNVEFSANFHWDK